MRYSLPALGLPTAVVSSDPVRKPIRLAFPASSARRSTCADPPALGVPGVTGTNCAETGPWATLRVVVSAMAGQHRNGEGHGQWQRQATKHAATIRASGRHRVAAARRPALTCVPPLSIVEKSPGGSMSIAEQASAEPTASPERPGRGSLLWPLGYALFVAVWALLFLRHNIDYGLDDSFISYRYAQNFADGYGLAFNPGERFFGTTAAGYAPAPRPAPHAHGFGDPETLGRAHNPRGGRTRGMPAHHRPWRPRGPPLADQCHLRRRAFTLGRSVRSPAMRPSPSWLSACWARCAWVIGRGPCSAGSCWPWPHLPSRRRTAGRTGWALPLGEPRYRLRRLPEVP